MKNFAMPVNIKSIKQTDTKTILTIEIDGHCKYDIMQYSNMGLHGELKLLDSRNRTAEQNRKFHATIGDISNYTGYPLEYTKEFFKYWFCATNDIEPFSTVECTVEEMRELISFVIEFCIENDIPLTELAIDRTDDIGKYLYYCITKQKCCVCGQASPIYSMPDKTKICLCDIHHDQAKLKGMIEFEKLFKVYPIKFDK
jgi:hypothetical protein